MSEEHRHVVRVKTDSNLIAQTISHQIPIIDVIVSICWNLANIESSDYGASGLGVDSRVVKIGVGSMRDQKDVLLMGGNGKCAGQMRAAGIHASDNCCAGTNSTGSVVRPRVHNCLGAGIESLAVFCKSNSVIQIGLTDQGLTGSDTAFWGHGVVSDALSSLDNQHVSCGIEDNLTRQRKTSQNLGGFPAGSQLALKCGTSGS